MCNLQVHHSFVQRVHYKQEQVDVSQTLAKQRVLDFNIMRENPSKSQTVDISS